ncbi:MAG: DNA primase [Oscillospiraceae bacterium]|nr:DNA primase [Oscillospiraceae bacterium]
MPLPDGFLDELTARNDIVDVVSDYVQLTKRSGSNMFGLCPFHSEKTPSFSVSQDRQSYHCFGCGKGGGVISFIMEIENLGFMDAVQFLARRAGMEVPEYDTPRELKNRRARMLELNRDAARFFYETLKTPKGADAVEYIKRRGISPEMAKRFGLGCAPNEWSALTDAMTKKGYTQYELVDAGLCKRGKAGGVYDAFRNRLMFPVIDVRGSVIGFSGRILDDGEPKYLNSPDTPVFSKSHNLFALNLAKKSKMGMLILVEGNIDVVSLHQAGFDCAVASLGTSLTNEQARLMSRYTDKVVIAYDNDGAGQKAAQRAIGIFENTGLQCRVLRMSGAKDPDEYIKKMGAEAFSLLLERSENHIEYRLLAVKSKYDLLTDDGRIAYLREATDVLASLSNSAERDVYSEKVADAASVSKDAVLNEVKRALARRIKEQRKREEKKNLRPEQIIQPEDKSKRYENPKSGRAEEVAVRALVRDPELIKTVSLTAESFTSPYWAKVFTLIKRRSDDNESVTESSIANLLEDDADLFTKNMREPMDVSSAAQSLADSIKKMETAQIKVNDDSALLDYWNNKRKNL